MAELFAGKEWQTFLQILPTIPFETWETVWSTVVATLMALVIGLPLGVCLVTGEQGGVRPLPRWLMALLNGLVNLLRSVPFLILMIIVIPLSRAIVGTSIGTVASIVPLVIASFPFVSRLVETSMREVDAGVIEAAQSMGATPLQIITKVMVPESMPSLVANVTIAATTIMGYGAMAGIIGGGGAMPHGAFAPSLTETTPVHIYEAMRSGPQQMPTFSKAVMDDQSAREIIASGQPEAAVNLLILTRHFRTAFVS